MSPDCLSRAQRFRVVRLAVCAAACAAAGVWLLHAQAPQSTPTFRSGIDVAQFDVTVLDKDHKPVRGLTAADFTVYVDGRPRPLVGFTPMDLPPPETPPAGWMRDVASDVVTNTQDVQRVVAIVMDDAYSGTTLSATGEHMWSPWILGAGKQIARDVVDHLGPNDLAAVTYTFMGRAQNLTTDRATLRQAIDAFAPKSSPSGGSALGCFYKGAYGCVVDTLLRVAAAMPTSPPRRNVIVFVSPGFPLEIDHPNQDAPGTTYEAANELVTALQRANITLYGYSPSGLETLKNPNQDHLIELAENTGGRAVVDTNAPWEGVPVMFEETGSYYLVGIDAGLADGKRHDIRVAINRTGVDVRNPRTYLAPSLSPPKKNGPVIDPVVQALGQSIPSGDLPLTMTLAAFAGAPGHDATIAIASELRQTFDPGQTSRKVTVVATALDTDWKEKSTVHQSFTTTLSRGSAAETAPVELFSRLSLPPGRYEVRLAADSLGRTGNLFADIDVPDFAKEPLSASGLVASVWPDAPSLPDGAFADLVPIVPTARRVFARTDRASAFLRVYQGGKDALSAVSVAATILDASDRRVREQPTTLVPGAFGMRRAADYSFVLPLSQLAPGAYLLRIDATKGTGPVHLSRTLRFTVAAPPAVPSASLVGEAVTPAAADPHTTALDAILSDVGRYLDGYGTAISAVLAEERYVQQVGLVGRPVSTRNLRSDLLVQAEPQIGWVTFRDVFEVDGHPVRDRDDRLAKLFAAPNPDAWQRARQIAGESARFNLNVSGLSVGRTVNVPTAALLFFRKEAQFRSTFRIEGQDTIDGRRVTDVSFEERAMPRLIGSADNVAMKGEAWIEPGTGRVLRTNLKYTTDAFAQTSTAVSIRVSYAEQPGIGLWAPVSMDEAYDPVVGGSRAAAPLAPRITARATYLNYRRFNVDMTETTRQR